MALWWLGNVSESGMPVKKSLSGTFDGAKWKNNDSLAPPLVFFGVLEVLVEFLGLKMRGESLLKGCEA